MSKIMHMNKKNSYKKYKECDKEKQQKIRKKLVWITFCVLGFIFMRVIA